MTMEAPARRSEGRIGDTLRFAPNYSVYLLPPDVVCLYSESRKFFLRGALYCALAERIGSGEDRASIVHALSVQFPASKIEEAFQRLLDRRFIVASTVAQDATAAYWASLGLNPVAAAENLQKVGVRVESLGAGGREGLTAALRGFGVRVSDDASDLTIALVGDYLDEGLAAFNERRLEDKQDWLPVQATGLFPLVGPIFSPGRGACWRCLSDRMKWNRQIRAFLDRKEARCVSASPLGAEILGSAGVSLAAAEIGKAIASGFRSDLGQHIVSLDMLGSEVARHYVPARPQCPVCGDATMRDPQRTPVPIRLRAGGRIVVTSGGYRSMTPAETVARHRKHVSPLTGVVSHLERISSDQPLDASFVARHNFSPSPETVEALQAGLSGDSYGKGNAAEQGEASALMEAIERYSGIFQGDEIRTTRRFVDFPAGEAIHPEEILHYSDAQYAESAKGCCSGDGAPRRFDPSAETEWSPVWSLRDDRFKYAPTGLLYFFHESESENRLSADSNGCAAGNTIEEAILQGFLELVERDAYAIWWYNRVRRPGIDLDALGDSYVCDLRAAFAAMGRDVWALDVTNDIGIPVVIAVAHWKEEGREFIEVAAGAHFDPRIATLRAMTELNQFLAIERLRGRPEGSGADDYGSDPLPLSKHAWLRPEGAAVFGPSPFGEFAMRDRREQVRACVTHMARKGFDFLVLDQTRPDIEAPVVRVIAPGLRHFYRRFGPGRLYDVPVALGWRQRPTRERDLNPLFPRT
ncbi:TOMM precursor leader peptide-binding protein [Methylocystis sp. IM2]|uniref:TOMM precursor leader peptide-binding protein n=1 Tax=Methylocystis sp. IM2 TaxID=3136563 RepID=UPI0030FC457F